MQEVEMNLKNLRLMLREKVDQLKEQVGVVVQWEVHSGNVYVILYCFCIGFTTTVYFFFIFFTF